MDTIILEEKPMRKLLMNMMYELCQQHADEVDKYLQFNKQLNNKQNIELIEGFGKEHLFMLMLTQGAYVCFPNKSQGGIKYYYEPKSKKIVRSNYENLPKEYIVFDTSKMESYVNNQPNVRMNGTKINNNVFDFEKKGCDINDVRSFKISKNKVKTPKPKDEIVYVEKL